MVWLADIERVGLLVMSLLLFLAVFCVVVALAERNFSLMETALKVVGFLEAGVNLMDPFVSLSTMSLIVREED
jgi:hypothetical protein